MWVSLVVLNSCDCYITLRKINVLSKEDDVIVGLFQLVLHNEKYQCSLWTNNLYYTWESQIIIQQRLNKC